MTLDYSELDSFVILIGLKGEAKITDNEGNEITLQGGESIVIQSDDKLVALVHPDMEEVNNLCFTDEDLENIMEQNRKELNMQIPSFAKVSRIKLHNQ